MFSSKIIIAIEVLLALDAPIVDADPCTPTGFDLSEYLSVYKMQKSVFRSVLRRLVQVEYVAQISGNKYVLRKNPATITVLDLVQVLHGDLCLGEAYAHSMTYGRENFDSTACRNLRRYELQMYHMLRTKLSVLPISRFWDSEGNATSCLFVQS